MNNILDYLDRDALLYPDKPAFCDASGAVSYSELQSGAARVASCLAELAAARAPVAIIMDKSVDNIRALFGVLRAGCFYVEIDPEMPVARIEKIFSTLRPAAIVSDETHRELAAALTRDGKPRVVDIKEALAHEIDRDRLSAIQRDHIDEDLAYVLYTSGSTGVPKGVAVNHRALIAYIEWLCSAFELGPETVFGSQTPLYFSMSVSDVYGTLASGGTYWIIERRMFMFPIRLIEWMNEKAINTIYWVPSAYAAAFRLRTFLKLRPETLRLALFAGEVMPPSVLQYWKEACGAGTRFANLFGPTETTDICSFYLIPEDWKDDGTPVPIGEACSNLQLLLLKEDGSEAGCGEEGELYVRGAFLAAGYYGDPEKTASAFVQNPLQGNYPERVYKTGDIVTRDRNGLLHYRGRKDSQIKHLGCRIDLGEIEAAAGSAFNDGSFAALYDKEKDRIVLFYCCGAADDEAVRSALKERLPSYMIPSAYYRVSEMPLNRNGKIDRKKLAELQDGHGGA